MLSSRRRPAANNPGRGFAGPLTWPRCAVGAACIAVTVLIDRVIRGVEPVDFLVYREGSAAALAGADIYSGAIAGTGLPFTYPPFAALVLWPLNIAGPRIGYLGWTLACAGCLAAAISWSLAPDRRTSGRIAAITVAGGLSIVGYQHLSFGQINLILLALCLGDITRPESRWVPRGVLIGIAAAIKLTPLLFIIFFAMTRQWRLARWSTAGFAAAGLLGWLVLPDMSRSFWLEVLPVLPDRAGLGPLFSSAGNGSPQGGLAALGAPAIVGATLSLIAALAGLLCARAVLREDGLFAAVVVVGLTAPLVSPLSWVHHWVYLIPAVVLIAQSGRRWLALGLTLVLLFPGGPATGDWLLARAPFSLPVAVAFREMLLLMTVAAIAALTIPRRRQADAQPSSRCPALAGLRRQQLEQPVEVKLEEVVAGGKSASAVLVEDIETDRAKKAGPH